MSTEVLSDVHTFAEFERVPGQNTAITRFEFIIHEETNTSYNVDKRLDLKRSLSLDELEKICTKKQRNDTCLSEKSYSDEEDSKKKETEIMYRRQVDDASECVSSIDCVKSESTQVTVDADGDLALRRNPKKVDELHRNSPKDAISYINIKHNLVTSLEAVGEQVWLGALLLCDYILDNRHEFTGQVVVDLGAGTGLTSIVSGLFADKVFCTDTGVNVLQLAQENVMMARLYPILPWSLCPVEVRDLDWFKDIQAAEDGMATFGLSKEDTEALQSASVIIAADVVYDKDITDAFFKTVWSLIDQPLKKTVYIALEKRLVFTLEDLAVTSPGYNHFRHKIDSLLVKGKDSDVNLVIKQIPADFRQYFNYKRSEQLELWKISSERDVT